MKIVDLRITGLAGGTVEGGWAKELTPEDNVHTIVAVSYTHLTLPTIYSV